MKAGALFQIAPYAAAIVFVAGIAIQYVVMRRGTGGSAHNLLDADRVSRGLWQFSLFVLIVGHLAGLVVPQWILRWSRAPYRLYALEAFGFGGGLLALGGWLIMMVRHFARTHGTMARQAADAVFLSLLFTTLVSGSLTAVLYRWGSSWAVLTLTPYVLSLFRAHPVVGLVSGMPFLVRLHVFSAFSMFAALPATRVGPWLITAVFRSVQWLSTPIREAAVPVRRFVKSAARRLHPAVWLWPEED